MIFYGYVDDIYLDGKYQKDGYIRPSFTSHLNKSVLPRITDKSYYTEKKEIDLSIGDTISLISLSWSYQGITNGKHNFICNTPIKITDNKNMSSFFNEWYKKNNISLQIGFNRAINMAIMNKSKEKEIQYNDYLQEAKVV